MIAHRKLFAWLFQKAKKSAPLAIAAAVPFLLLGQKNGAAPLRFELFFEADGLSSQNLFDLKESRDGFLWVGANNGLNRFDGIEFRQFFNDKNSARRLQVPAEKIRHITEDRDGNLWLASAVGVFFLNPNSTRVRLFSQTNSTFPTEEVAVVKALPDGQILAGTEGGLALFDAKNGRFEWAVGGQIGEINDFIFDRKGQLWLATSSLGLVRFDLKTGKKTSFLPFSDVAPNHDANSFYSILETPDGRFWAGGVTSGLWLFDAEKGAFERCFFWQKSPEKRLANVVFDIEAQPNPNGLQLWLGTNAGIVEFWPDRRDSFLVHTLGMGFLSDVRDLCFTRNGTLWAATAYGLASAKPNNRFFAPSTEAIDDMIRSMAFSEKEKTWRVLGSKSIFKLDSNFQLIQKWPFRAGLARLEQPALRSCAFDSQGRFWISGGSGVFIFDEKKGTARQIAGRPLGSPLDKNDRYFLAIERLPGGKMAVGSWRSGLFLFDEATEKNRRFSVAAGAKDSLWADEIFNLFWHEKSSRLFVGTRLGVAEMDMERGVFQNYFDPNSAEDGSDVAHFSPARSGNIWVGTDKQGLAVFEPKKGFLGRFGIQHGLPDRQIQWTSEEPSGKIWLLAGEKIVRFDPARPDESHVFLRAESPPDGQSIGSFTHDGEPGDRFFIGYNGNRFYHFSPREFIEMPPSRPYLTGLKIGGRDTFFERPFAQIERIDLQYWQNSLTFEFSALSLENGPNELFFYQLLGVDKTWVKRPKARSANYAFLPPGEYRFRVKSTFSEQPAELLVNIRQAFWQTWWFRLGSVLAALGLVYYFFHQRFLRKLAVERTRNRIARDLHDSLASDLSAIPAYNDVAKMLIAKSPEDAAAMLEKSSAVARTSDENVRNIIWAADPKLDTLDDLAARLREKIGGVCEAKNIAFSVEIEAGLEGKKLDIAHRSNLFYIAREAAQNAVKYAECSKIDIFFSKKGPKTLLEIADDGCCFDLEKVQKGKGLENMARRAEEMRARLDFLKNETGGATWRLLF